MTSRDNAAAQLIVESTHHEMMWLDQWMPDNHRTYYRYHIPTCHEPIAIAGSAYAYTRAVLKLIAHTQSTSDAPHDKARAIATFTSVLANFVAMAHARFSAETHPNDLDDYPSQEQTEHSTQLMQNCINTVIQLAQDTAQRMEDADVSRFPDEIQFLESTSSNLSPNGSNTAYHHQPPHLMDAQRASITGNCAALNWHIDQLAELDPMASYKLQSAHVLTMWTVTQNLQDLPLVKSQDNSRYEADLHTKQETIQRLNQTDTLAMIDGCTPYVISPEAAELIGPNSDYFLGDELSGTGPQSDAIYDWDLDSPPNVIMAYRYQAYTHVKAASEPYQHEIDVQTALAHCNEFERIIMQRHEAYDPICSELVKAALLNRSMIHAGLHYTPRTVIETSIEVARTAIPEQTTLYSAIKASVRGLEEPAQHLAYRYGLHSCPLTDTQAHAALDAARKAGASKPALRDMVEMLYITPEKTHSFGITPAPKVRWRYANTIIQQLHNLCKEPSSAWLNVAEAIGWSTSSNQLRKLAQQLDETEVYTAYLEATTPLHTSSD